MSESKTEQKSIINSDFTVVYDQNKHKSILYIGMKIIVEDTVHNNVSATILEIKENNIYITYNCWGDKWDEWIKTTCSCTTCDIRLLSVSINIGLDDSENLSFIFDQLWSNNEKCKITSNYSLVCGSKTIYSTKQLLADNFELFGKYFNLIDEEEANTNAYKMKNIQSPEIILMITLYIRNKWKQSLIIREVSDVADILNLFSFYQCTLNKLVFKDSILKFVTKQNLCEILEIVGDFIEKEPIMCGWIMTKISSRGLIDYSNKKVTNILKKTNLIFIIAECLQKTV